MLSSAGAGPWGEAPSSGLTCPSSRSRKTATTCKSSFPQDRYLEFEYPRLRQMFSLRLVRNASGGANYQVTGGS